MLIGVVIIVALFGGASYINLSQPDNLGVNNGQLAPLNSRPNGVSSQAQSSQFKVEPLPMLQTREQTMQQIQQSLGAMSQHQVVTQTENYLHAVFISATMRYRDDVELYIDESAQRVHYRSQSRLGYSDMGVNLARYQRFAELYTAQPE